MDVSNSFGAMSHEALKAVIEDSEAGEPLLNIVMDIYLHGHGVDRTHCRKSDRRDPRADRYQIKLPP